MKSLLLSGIVKSDLRYSLLTGPLGGENKVVGPVVL